MTRVLIIDDDASIRRLATLGLQHHGFEVIQASDGRSGLAKARAFAPDLVLADVRMDGMDGYDLVATMRSEPALATIPVILISGNADLSGLRRGMSLGADDYLPKPFGVAELVAAVRLRLARYAETMSAASARIDELRRDVVSLLPDQLLTPLASVVGVAQLLQLDADMVGPADIRLYAGLLLDSAARIQRLVGNALMFANLEVCQLEPSRVAALCCPGREPAADIVRARAEEEAACAGRSSDLVALIDDAHVGLGSADLGTLVGELVRSAFESSEPGTEVEVSLAADPTGGGTLAIVDQGLHVDRPRRAHGGEDLGLSICRRLVQLVGGTFTIERAVTSGTRVRVALPAAA